MGVGAIARVRLVTDRESGRSKGFAYVDVFEEDVADRVRTFCMYVLCMYVVMYVLLYI